MSFKKKTLFFTFLFMIFGFSFVFSTVPSGYNEKTNETNLNVTIDQNGWCSLLETKFTIYASEEYDILDEIEDDEDVNVTVLDTYVEIFDGPFENQDKILFEKALTTQDFTFVFPKADKYLFRVVSKGSRNPHEEELEIDDCEYLTEEIKEVIDPQNLTLDLPGTKLSLSIKNTLTKSFDIAFDTYDQKNLILTNPLEEPFTTFRISYPNDFTSTASNISGQLDETSTYTLYLYDQNKKEYVLTKSGVTFENGTFTYKTPAEGYYLLKEIPELVEESETDTAAVAATTSTTSPETQTPEISPVDELVEDTPTSAVATNDYLKWGLIGLAVILLLVFAPKLFSTTKKEDFYHDDNRNDAIEKITSYKETHDKTQEYVRSYKDKYSQDSIRKALVSAGVDKGVIDTVFKEEFVQK